MGTNSALGQSAAFPEAPAEQPAQPPPPVAPSPAAPAAPAAPKKRGPYQQVLGPYQRNPPRDDVKKDERPEYALGDPAGLYTHDGFFFRVAGGFGGMSDGVDGSGSALARNSVSGSSEFSGTASGLAFATEVAVGFTPLRGLVIGAAIYTATAPAPTSKESGVAGKYEFALTQLELFALFADYYFDENGGFHAQAGGGFGALIMGQGTGQEGGPSTHAHTAVGPGLMLGAGYEWWVSEQWGMGVLARGIYGWSSASDPRGVSWEHGTLGYALLATATYH